MQWNCPSSAGRANCQFDQAVTPGPEPCRKRIASFCWAAALVFAADVGIGMIIASLDFVFETAIVCLSLIAFVWLIPT